VDIDYAAFDTTLAEINAGLFAIVGGVLLALSVSLLLEEHRLQARDAASPAGDQTEPAARATQHQLRDLEAQRQILLRSMPLLIVPAASTLLPLLLLVHPPPPSAQAATANLLLVLLGVEFFAIVRRIMKIANARSVS
jgi:hypothetical protein